MAEIRRPPLLKMLPKSGSPRSGHRAGDGCDQPIIHFDDHHRLVVTKYLAGTADDTGPDPQRLRTMRACSLSSKASVNGHL
ncbi:hypothetical protein, partial [Mycobacterium sp. WUMAC-025]|uniref:hypothetical protein n=1 Tax=Mycobacterium sp. WUMAC-025 TaxID=2798586 RepID=UPI001CDA4AB5